MQKQVCITKQYQVIMHYCVINSCKHYLFHDNESFPSTDDSFLSEVMYVEKENNLK